MIGTTISHYHILEEIAEGGMGTVYKAEDTKLKRTVALKFISGKAVKDHQTRTRFVQEAQTAASVNHPNINTVYEIVEAEDKVFIAMEYIEGQTLKEMVGSGPVSLADALDIGVQVASGLQAAHEKGLVHRDIKSSNVMITPQGRAKIMDFGLVKVLHGTQITRTAVVMGTVAYMSPEQAGNEIVDQRSDIWSLGVLLYEMIAGALPFGEGDSMVVLYSILNKPPKPIEDLDARVPAGLERIIRKCLEKKAEMRYQTAAQLKNDLMQLRRDLDSGRARPYTPTTRLFQRSRAAFRRPGVVAGVIILALILFLAVFPFRRTLRSLFTPSRVAVEEQGLAVLPINCIGGSDEDRVFCRGLYVLLNSRLTQLQRDAARYWLVPSVEVVERDVRSAADAQKVFNVDLVVDPNIDYTAGGIKVTLNLIDARRQRQLDTRLLSYEAPDRLADPEKIIASLAAMLDLEISPAAGTDREAGLSPVTEAAVYYTRGIGYLQDYRDRDSLEHAIDFLTQATRADPKFALAYSKLGEAYWRRWGETRQSADLIQARGHSRTALGLNDRLAPVRIAMGILLRETGDIQNAIQEFARALEIDPDSADAYREMALAYQAADNPEEAERFYQRAIDINPAYWGGYSHLGVFYYRNGRIEEAERALCKVTELAPDNHHGYNLLGAIIYAQGRLDDAQKLYEKSLTIKPNYRALSNLGTMYFSQERYGDATEMFEQAALLMQNDHKVWGNLGDSQRYTPGISGEQVIASYTRASGLARKDLSTNPQNTQARAFLAFYYAALGDSGHALDEIQTIRRGGSQDVMVLRLCLRAYEILGMRAQALEVLERYVALGGQVEEIESNPDLAELRNDPRYRELVQDR